MILLVGDHGVGKTAAVYGVAEEACYDVFEIHSGMKRAGKDLMAAVGDMAENHQVIFDSTAPAVVVSETNGGVCLKKPKDKKNPIGSIMSYLQVSKEKPTHSDLSDNQHATREAYQDSRDTKTTMTPIDHQITRTNTGVSMETMLLPRSLETRQSLILLEEVDNLFEEDKGFWAAVTSLAQKSKRPIVMTCNDIKSIPIRKLTLQAVLAFKTPEEKRLLPYLQLVCFSEGYLVEPYDLACLIDVVGCDLRQLLYTLEMWCKTHKLPNHQDAESGKKRFYKLQGLFDHIMGYSDGEWPKGCLYTLHSAHHLSGVSLGYDPMAYKEDSMDICVQCLKDKAKTNNLPGDLGAMESLLSTASTMDIWSLVSEKQSLKEAMMA
ncbi:P-loop containing nucleoside triphosphate hydrolase protein [Phycomyces nitens]|nr:P-loop containing nucleoside triphosphate hydrolase protein [Phycomyces nitens]